MYRQSNDEDKTHSLQLPPSQREAWYGRRCELCYKFPMKIVEQWLLFKYVEGQFTPMSKPFKTKSAAEKARSKLPERERRSVAVGVIRMKK
jgi:hypothetical protein